MNRLSWLEDQLDNDSLPQALRDKYEREAASLAEAMTKREVKERAAILERDQLRARLIAEDLSVVDTHGIPEFGDDYEVLIENTNHVVYSKVSRQGQVDRWVLSTPEKAEAKRRQLIYYRLYDKYVRDGEIAKLDEL